MTLKRLSATSALRLALLPLAASLVSGGVSAGEYVDPRDPIEGFNREMYEFNANLDTAVLKPLAEGYRAVAPEPVDRGVTNFFSNLGDVRSAVNNLLQFKLRRAGTSVGRVAINSTVGLLGVLDVATGMDLPKADEDFGQTLGVWGAGPGPYLVLPILGPSSVRDAFGWAADRWVDPVIYIDPAGAAWGLRTLDIVDTRADMLGASRVLKTAALDEYEFVRDAFLQKRVFDIHDGNPPEDADMELEDEAPERPRRR